MSQYHSGKQKKLSLFVINCCIISCLLCGCVNKEKANNVSNQGIDTDCYKEYALEGTVLKSEIVYDDTTKFPVRRYYFDDANIHGGYVNNSLYIDDDTFYFLSDCNGSANIYLLESKNEAIYQVTDTLNQDLYENVNSFGLTLCTANDSLFYSLENNIYRFNCKTKNSEKVIDSTIVGGRYGHPCM